MLIVAGRNRIYAVTTKDRIITSCFGVIVVSQFILGLYTIIYAAMQGGVCDRVPGPGTVLTHFTISVAQIPQIPLRVYGFCIFVQHRDLEIGFTTVSLLFGAKSPLSFVRKGIPTLITPQTF